MKKQILIFPALLIALFLSCTDNDKDDEYPIISLTAENAFPKNCDTVYIGETFTFNALFTDNVELGAFSIDIHHNFDHHSHGSFNEECVLEPVKDPENPFLFIGEHTIPDGLKEYSANVDIIVPNDVDPGDYHFSIRLTDKEGWQETLGISIKIL